MRPSIRSESLKGLCLAPAASLFLSSEVRRKGSYMDTKVKDGKQAGSWVATGETLKCEALGALAPPVLTDLREEPGLSRASSYKGVLC